MTLTRFFRGVYGDDRNRVFIDVPQLLAKHRLTDTPANRRTAASAALTALRHEWQLPQVLIAKTNGIAADAAGE